jgi:hypothetical protein
VQSTYLFTEDAELRKHYCTKDGDSIRYGKIIEDMDAMAGDCSYKYLLESHNSETDT